jgi:hypothetical protein
MARSWLSIEKEQNYISLRKPLTCIIQLFGDLEDCALVCGRLCCSLGFLFLLKSAEVVLDQEGGVELPHRHVVFN